MESTNQPMGPPPDNNLVWAILCTVLCCLPFGIVSIIKSTKVKELWAQGDTVWGAVAAGIVWVLYVIFFVVVGLGGAFAGY